MRSPKLHGKLHGKLQRKIERKIGRLTAAAVHIVSLALSLSLSLSLAACRAPALPSPPPPPPAAAVPVATVPAPAAAPAAARGQVAVSVTEEGFVPSRIPARQGKPITLAVTRTTDRTCARDLVFQDQAGKTPLPLGKTVEVTYTPKTSGEIRFGCAMGMMVSGVLTVSD